MQTQQPGPVCYPLNNDFDFSKCVTLAALSADGLASKQFYPASW